MADTIIISPISEPVRVGQRDAGPVQWRCLSRRGMVFADLEGFDFTRIPAGGTLRGSAHPYTEIVLFVIRGEGSAEVEPHTQAISERDLVMLPTGGEYSIIATGPNPLELLSVELIPGTIADRLPYRTPQLVELPDPEPAS